MEGGGEGGKPNYKCANRGKEEEGRLRNGFCFFLCRTPSLHGVGGRGDPV